jgi:hypothetical protein
VVIQCSIARSCSGGFVVNHPPPGKHRINPDKYDDENHYFPKPENVGGNTQNTLVYT